MTHTAHTGTDAARHPSRRLLHYALAALVASFALVAVGCSAFEGSDEDASEPQSMTTGGATSAGSRGDADDGGMKGEFGAVAPSGAPAPQPGADYASAGTEGSGTGSAANLQGTLDRTIIRNGSVEIEVESVAQSFDQVRQIAEAAGGFVAESSFTGSGDHQSAGLTLRIPADRFGDVVANLQDMAVEVHHVTSSSEDITEEFADLEASLRNLRAVEQQYLTLLSSAEDIEDILLVQDRLNGVRYEIERIQGRVNLLDNLASLATVRVSLVPTAGSIERVSTDPGFTDRVGEAWESSLDAIATVGTAIVVAAVWSWWLVPLLIVAVWFGRRYATRTPRPRVDTPEGAA